MRIRRATVKKVNYKKGTVKVLFDDTGKEKETLDDVCVCCGFAKSTRMPDKGAQVLVLIDDDIGSAYCLGEFYNGSGSKPKGSPTKDEWQMESRDLTLDGRDLMVDGRKVTVRAGSIIFETNQGTKEF